MRYLLARLPLVDINVKVFVLWIRSKSPYKTEFIKFSRESYLL